MDTLSTSDDPAQGQASQVAAESGKVIVDGPGGVAITLSPDAAEETANRLLAAVAQARRQTSCDDPGEGKAEQG